MCKPQTTQGPARPHPAPRVPFGRRRPKARRKLWELPRHLHCPVIGTCLQVDELRRLARKAGIGRRADTPLRDYQLHLEFVASADARNPLSVAAHKALERKLGGHVRRFGAARTGEQLAELWDNALERGEVPGALWATVTHPACDEVLRTRVYEEVHMLSHQIGAGQRADLKALAASRDELAALRWDFDALHARSRQQVADRDQRIHELEARLRDAEGERSRIAGTARALQRELEDLRIATRASHLADLERRVGRLDQVEAERDGWRQAAEAARDRVTALEARCREQAAQCAALEGLVAREAAGCEGCPADSGDPAPNLGGRCILCVGGRTRLVDQYRAVVTGWNGRFEHHDGGVEERARRLESLLSTADAVVCATDCVSHGAYQRLKRFCKAYGKPHVFLDSSGLTSFARAVESMAG